MSEDAAVAPSWFEQALATPGEVGEVAVHGATVRWLAWGEPAAPPLVLVHGGAAHAQWWSPLAPMLTSGYRVVALDLSGHGDSDHRRSYDAEVWAGEVLAVAQAAGGQGAPTVVGHSMGGFVAMVAAARHGPSLAGAIVLDSPVRRPDPETEEAQRTRGSMFGRPKTYPDLATALEHFHLVPPQPTRNPWLLDHVARHSLRPTTVDGEERWRWKFDPAVFVERAGPKRPSDYAAELGAAACRLAFVHGERSAIVDDHVLDYVSELVAGAPAASAGVPLVEVPDAHHHLLLDEPLATVTALRTLLATWSPVGASPAPVVIEP